MSHFRHDEPTIIYGLCCGASSCLGVNTHIRWGGILIRSERIRERTRFLRSEMMTTHLIGEACGYGRNHMGECLTSGYISDAYLGRKMRVERGLRPDASMEPYELKPLS